MKFYDCQTAPSPRRVRMFILEKGLDIPTIQVDLGTGEHLGEAFLKINPNGTVPVLELPDGTHLTSTAACRAYLEEAHPEPALLGRDAVEKGKVADLLYHIEADGFSAVGECLRNTAKGLKGRAMVGTESYEQIPELGERGRLRAARFYPALDAMIGDKPFVAGDQFTAADIDAFIFAEFTRWIKVTCPDDCQNVKRWQAAISERASAKA